MNKSNELYELYEPSTDFDRREYVIVVTKNGKRYGYLKRIDEAAIYQQNPNTRGMKFIGYLKRYGFEKRIFLDVL